MLGEHASFVRYILWMRWAAQVLPIHLPVLASRIWGSWCIFQVKVQSWYQKLLLTLCKYNRILPDKVSPILNSQVDAWWTTFASQSAHRRHAPGRGFRNGEPLWFSKCIAWWLACIGALRWRGSWLCHLAWLLFSKAGGALSTKPWILWSWAVCWLVFVTLESVHFVAHVHEFSKSILVRWAPFQNWKR